MLIRKHVLQGFVALTLCAWAIAAAANDTDLTTGGSPKPMRGHTTVSMQSEYVKVVVGADVAVDCRFTFINRGPACKVRMGFPDFGGEPGEDINPKTGKPFPKTPNIQDFRSWVNGKPVKTSAVADDDTGDFWHVKRVDFPAHGTVVVRDRYSVGVGSTVAYYPASTRLAEYVLHTGASWHGNIGRSEVEVVVSRKSIRSPFIVRRMPGRHGIPQGTRASDRRTIYYKGPCKPAVSGRTLRFVRTNWQPRMEDDILLLFDVQRRPTGK